MTPKEEVKQEVLHPLLAPQNQDLPVASRNYDEEFQGNMHERMLKIADLHRIMCQILALVFLIVIIPTKAFSADSVLLDCVYSWDFGNDNKEVTVVYPLSEVCFHRCKAECENFGLTIDQNASENLEDNIQSIETNQDLNRDIIDQCYLTCQKGSIFKSKYRIPFKDPSSSQVFKWSDDFAETAAFCGGSQIADAEYAYFGSGLEIDPTDTSCSDSSLLSTCNNSILINLLNPPDAGGNMIHLCGFASARLDPVTHSLVNAEWIANQWGNVLGNGRVPSIGEPPSTLWHARNNGWLDSGIDIKDGDYLSIKFGDNYGISLNPHIEKGMISQLEVWMPGGDGKFSINSPYEVIPGNSLELPQFTGDPNGEDVEYDPSIEDIQQNNRNVSWKGLGIVYNSNPQSGGWAQVWTENRPMSSSLQSSADASTQEIRKLVANPNNEDQEMYRMQVFSGVLNGLSKKYFRLAFRHFDAAPEHYVDNLGGMSVLTTWKGCIFSKGERLQYAVVPSPGANKYYKPEDLSDSEWIDLKPEQMDGSRVFRVEGNEFGQIFFRIKKLQDTYTTDEGLAPTCSTSADPCTLTHQNVIDKASEKYARYNTGGSYMLSVEKTAHESVIGGNIGWFVNEIYEYLFTDDPDNARKGIVPKMFRKFIATPSFINSIRAVLILYMAWTGLSYMIGLAKINQQDGLIRLFKISLVLIVISDKGFDFFNYYLFDAIKIGAMEIMVQIVTPIYEVSSGGDAIVSGSIAEKIMMIFSVFDKPFKTLFSDALWNKVCALILSGLLGIVVAAAIIIAAVLYVFCIAKCTLIFLYFLVFTALLMMLAPIFITFILFKFTRPMFDSWIKSLISFSLQPLFVFTAVSLLNTLLMAALYTTLSFTACKMCFLGFYIPVIVDICIIPGWIALITSHNPMENAVAAPIANVPAAILLLIVSQAFYTFCGFCTVIAQTIAMGSYFGVNFADNARENNPITAAQSVLSGIATATGTDASSRYYHRNREAKKDAKKETKEDTKRRDGASADRSTKVSDDASSSASSAPSTIRKD